MISVGDAGCLLCLPHRFRERESVAAVTATGIGPPAGLSFVERTVRKLSSEKPAEFAFPQ